MYRQKRRRGSDLHS